MKYNNLKMIDENYHPINHDSINRINVQANAYYKLLGGSSAKCGNEWDTWNLINVSWNEYNDSDNRSHIKSLLKEKLDYYKTLGLDGYVNFYEKKISEFS